MDYIIRTNYFFAAVATVITKVYTENCTCTARYFHTNYVEACNTDNVCCFSSLDKKMRCRYKCGFGEWKSDCAITVINTGMIIGLTIAGVLVLLALGSCVVWRIHRRRAEKHLARAVFGTREISTIASTPDYTPSTQTYQLRGTDSTELEVQVSNTADSEASSTSESVNIPQRSSNNQRYEDNSQLPPSYEEVINGNFSKPDQIPYNQSVT